MTRRGYAAAVLAAVATLTSCTDTAPSELAPPEQAEVVAVVDGDTIDVESAAGRERIRIIGIDTPEIDRESGADDCYAQEARTQLDELIYAVEVELRADPTQASTDKYGRELRHVYIDGQSVALTLIAAGAGIEYTYDAAYAGQAEHVAAEEEARAKARGLWGACEIP